MIWHKLHKSTEVSLLTTSPRHPTQCPDSGWELGESQLNEQSLSPYACYALVHKHTRSPLRSCRSVSSAWADTPSWIRMWRSTSSFARWWLWASVRWSSMTLSRAKELWVYGKGRGLCAFTHSVSPCYRWWWVLRILITTCSDSFPDLGPGCPLPTVTEHTIFLAEKQGQKTGWLRFVPSWGVLSPFIHFHVSSLSLPTQPANSQPMTTTPVPAAHLRCRDLLEESWI